MRILSFDTSTSNLYACLADGQKIQAEQTIICNPLDRQFAASLIMPTLIAMLKESGWQKADLQMITVGTGPGSFTGSRVAVVTARTLCQALDLPLLGINRFQCYAFMEQIRSFPSAMILQAGKNQYFCAQLDKDIVAESASTMDTCHLQEYAALEKYQDCKHIYIEKTAALTESKISPIPQNWHLLPELINPAVIQAQISFKQMQPYSQLESKSFSYKLVKPLYIQNASITVKKNIN